MMGKTFVFSGMFCVGAETEEEARDGLMELMAEIVARNNDEAFGLDEILTEADDEAPYGDELCRNGVALADCDCC
jgi:hypothetical protein